MAKFIGRDFVGDDGQIMTARNDAEAQRYTDMMYQPATVKDIQHDEIRKVYDNWYGAAAAFGQGVLSSIPFAQTAMVGVIGSVQGDQAARDYAAEVSGLQAANPISSFAGSAVGTVAGVGAASKVAAGVSAAMEGTGLLGMSPLTQGAATLQQVGTGAAMNVAYGAANLVDRAALANAAQPDGIERVFANAGTDLLFDGIVGAGLGAAPALLKKMGNWGDALANKQVRQGLVDNKAYADLVSQGRSTQFGQAMDNYQLWGKSPAEARAVVSSRIDELTETMNEVKRATKDMRMAPMQSAALTDELGTILGETHPADAERAVQSLMESGNAPNLGELHSIRQRLDSKINWGVVTDEAAAAQQPLVEARNAVDRHMTQYLQGLKGSGAPVDTWNAVQSEYGTMGLLKDGLRKAGDAVGPNSDRPWYNNLLGSALGAMFSPKLHVAYAGAKKLSTMIENGELAEQAKAMAGLFHNTSEKLSKAVSGGLMGAAAETAALLHADAPKGDDFDLYSAQVRHGMKDPVKATSGVFEMAAAAGLPDEMVSAMSTKAVTVNGLLGGALPKPMSPGWGANLPSTSKPSRMERDKWIGQYNSATDPSYAVLHPTAENMQVMKTVYPELYKTTCDAIRQQLAANRDVPLHGQMWASRVLGYPVGGLADPFFYTLMKTVRMPKQPQQAAPAAGSPGTGDNVDSSELTRTQSLQQGK